MWDIHTKLLAEVKTKTLPALQSMMKNLYPNGSRSVDTVVAKFENVNITPEAKAQLGKYLKSEYNMLDKRIKFMSKNVRSVEPKKKEFVKKTAERPIDIFDDAISHYERLKAIEATVARTGQATERQSAAIASEKSLIENVRILSKMAPEEFNVALKNKKSDKDNAKAIESLKKTTPQDVYVDEHNEPIYQVVVNGKTHLIAKNGKTLAVSKGRSSIDVLDGLGVKARRATKEEQHSIISELKSGKSKEIVKDMPK